MMPLYDAAVGVGGVRHRVRVHARVGLLRLAAPLPLAARFLLRLPRCDLLLLSRDTAQRRGPPASPGTPSAAPSGRRGGSGPWASPGRRPRLRTGDPPGRRSPRPPPASGRLAPRPTCSSMVLAVRLASSAA